MHDGIYLYKLKIGVDLGTNFLHIFEQKLSEISMRIFI